jgi:AraC family transcriptional regulator
MSDKIVFIKNMVCHRCLLAVEEVLNQLSIQAEKILPGEVHLKEPITEQHYQMLNEKFIAIGLELIDNKTTSLIERIKKEIIMRARNEVPENEISEKLSSYLSRKLFHEYTYLSSLFSSVEGKTIENYFIQQRIEKVKELLVYNEMTLSAIAFEMGYSSTSHLSSQFKQITGLTPSHFKNVGSTKRKLIETI